MNTRLTVPMNNQESTVLGLKPFIHIDTLIKSCPTCSQQNDHLSGRNRTLL
jgi:hypothetical protein